MITDLQAYDGAGRLVIHEVFVRSGCVCRDEEELSHQHGQGHRAADRMPTRLIGSRGKKIIDLDSNHDPLDLIETDLIAPAIVELRRAR